LLEEWQTADRLPGLSARSTSILASMVGATFLREPGTSACMSVLARMVERGRGAGTAFLGVRAGIERYSLGGGAEQPGRPL